ncbi:MAG TPA: hypothetical protein DCZ95_06040 [Verrucomicrobia bacterium]|nr:MAG: hypothetical protein A2X46_03840 [Lentisphaerae bacterium GWF2_57_35]HBA83638.1 hypothetical protein [Verrucomicrobiota bacterium]
MKTLIACMAGIMAISGCAKQPASTPEQNASVMLTADAAIFMAILKDTGGFPEIAATRKGNLQSGMMCDLKPAREYPFNTFFRSVMEDAPDTTYGFIVNKESPLSPWVLSKVWKETNGERTDMALPSADMQAKANAELQRRK